MNAVTTQKKEQSLTKDRVNQDRFLTPEVDIYENKDEYLLESDMPGVTKEGLELTLDGQVLTIVGHRHPETVPGNPLYRESQQYDFRRIFELDPAIDTGKISARMENGILLVRLPKAEKVKPRKIAIGD